MIKQRQSGKIVLKYQQSKKQLENVQNILIILGAGKPKFGTKNESLLKDSLYNTTLLDWQLNMAQSIFNDVIYVAGFGVDDLKRDYSNLNIVINENWENTGPVGSLSKVKLDNNKNYTVIYADLAFTEFPPALLANDENQIKFAYGMFQEIGKDTQSINLNSKEKVVIENKIPLRFGYDCPMLTSTHEFYGAISARGKVFNESLAKCQQTLINNESFMLSSLCEIQRLNNVSLCPVDVNNTCFEINSQKDLSRKVLGTKAETLKRLQNVLNKSIILVQEVIHQKDWLTNSDECVNSVLKKFTSQKLVVRSSAISEDSFESAFAGVYDSFLGVKANKDDVRQAINNVFASYQSDDGNNQVLIQPMLEDVSISGVIFTRSIDFSSPYYIINFDQTSGLTDTVTAGEKATLETLKIAKYKEDLNPEPSSKWQAELIQSIREIENLIKLDELDVEFAIDSLGKIYILQVRPIVSSVNESDISDEIVEKRIKKAKNIYEKEVLDNVLGAPIYAQMPDWNPAEIIGARSNYLPYSLYAKIITENIWAIQRYENGNCDLRGIHLLKLFCGKPYVFVNASLKSFIPNNLPDYIKDLILTCALKRYKDNLHLHDKLEFEIIPTCFTADNEKWRKIYVEDQYLSEQQFELWMQELKETTRYQILKISDYIKMSQTFDVEFTKIKNSDLSPILQIKRVLFLLQDLGTISFAHLARCGFISISILNSLAKSYPKSKSDIHEFQKSIKTISTRLSGDIQKVRKKTIDKSDFIENYGHLRPSTYDINSPTYAENFDNLILSGTVATSSEHNSSEINLADTNLLTQISNSLGVKPDELSNFLAKGIQWREESKFIFTKGLSFVLSTLKDLNPYGLYSSGEIKHLGINEILSILDNDINKSACFQLVASRKENALIDQKIELPQVISKSIDFEYFYIGNNEINFIGTKAVTAPLISLSDCSESHMNLCGCIALIESADPGYDWLFSHNILGLITQYGGANSHMAIRAVEYNIPAAIGIGELHRKRIENVTHVELDCVNKILRGVS